MKEKKKKRKNLLKRIEKKLKMGEKRRDLQISSFCTSISGTGLNFDWTIFTHSLISVPAVLAVWHRCHIMTLTFGSSCRCQTGVIHVSPLNHYSITMLDSG